MQEASFALSSVKQALHNSTRGSTQHNVTAPRVHELHMSVHEHSGCADEGGQYTAWKSQWLVEVCARYSVLWGRGTIRRKGKVNKKRSKATPRCDRERRSPPPIALLYVQSTIRRCVGGSCVCEGMCTEKEEMQLHGRRNARRAEGRVPGTLHLEPPVCRHQRQQYSAFA